MSAENADTDDEIQIIEAPVPAQEEGVGEPAGSPVLIPDAGAVEPVAAQEDQPNRLEDQEDEVTQATEAPEDPAAPAEAHAEPADVGVPTTPQVKPLSAPCATGAESDEFKKPSAAEDDEDLDDVSQYRFNFLTKAGANLYHLF